MGAGGGQDKIKVIKTLNLFSSAICSSQSNLRIRLFISASMIPIKGTGQR